MEERREYQDYKAFWVAMLALLLLTRIPVTASYLSIDNVNLAFSLDNFDPSIHQPQPPGYPFFVLLGKIVNFGVRDPERTFIVISVLVSGLCLPAAFALGKRMFSAWAGIAGAFLLLVNPVFWHSGLDGPLRPNLALFSLLTAYCSWRCWNGEKQFALWGAAALGIGSGFRPDLIAFLFPVWLISVWAGTKSWKVLLQSVALLTFIVVVWVTALIVAMGGFQTFQRIMLEYVVDQSRSESVVFGSSVVAWLRQINRLVIWNGLAVIGWVWAILFYFRHRGRLAIGSSQTVFFLIWLVPGLTAQALIHVAAPGHTLFSVAALCVLGGYFLSLVPAREVVLSCALIINVMLFLDFLQLPVGATNSPAGAPPSIKNAMLFGTFETSLGYVRWFDEITRTTLKEIEEFTPPNRPSIIISTDTYADQWFMNWRIARYYLPARDLWILYNNIPKKRAEHIRRDKIVELKETGGLRIPVFNEGRIIWLIEPHGPLHKQVSGLQKLSGGKYVFYSDISHESTPFTVDGFEIVPAPFGLLPNQN